MSPRRRLPSRAPERARALPPTVNADDGQLDPLCIACAHPKSLHDDVVGLCDADNCDGYLHNFEAV